MKQITVGIIGAGRIGKVHAQSIALNIPGAKIKTIADVYMNDETINWAKSLGIENTTKDYLDIINDKDIEVVLICSST
ncbi:MAG: Gfo/Idh/MocA family oxidoreductase, partial [Spirochaetales bacterium]|nr:Gfo/Idh/MocA family oxidoreductase [Spirochaetales bacterium]